jgi:hypothetical protein
MQLTKKRMAWFFFSPQSGEIFSPEDPDLKEPFPDLQGPGFPDGFLAFLSIFAHPVSILK